MSNSTDDTLPMKYTHLSEQCTKYVGILLYITCLFGTLMNILTFVQRTYHSRPCSLYLLVASACDFVHLNFGPLTNILQHGFQYDWTITSMAYCKMKSYLVFVFTVMSATFTTMASIDRFILSSRNVNRWRFSTRPMALRFIIATIVFWFVFSVPISFCVTRFNHASHNEQLVCSNPSRAAFCFWIQIFYTCIFNGFLPPLAMIYFGLLTCANARRLRQRASASSDRVRRINCQLTSMLVLQSVKSSFASLPFSVFNSYLLLTLSMSKSTLHQAKENLANQVVYLLFWSNYTSFFVYMYSSDIFRHQCLRGLKKLMCCRCGTNQRREHRATALRHLTDRLITEKFQK